MSSIDDTLEINLHVGGQLHCLKATDAAERERWVRAMSPFLEREVDAICRDPTLQDRQMEGSRIGEAEDEVPHNFVERGNLGAAAETKVAESSGIRADAPMEETAGEASASRRRPTTIQGWLRRQDAHLMRRWRRWWCEIDRGHLVCTLFDSVRISDLPGVAAAGRRTLPFSASFSGSASRRALQQQQPPPPPAADGLTAPMMLADEAGATVTAMTSVATVGRPTSNQSSRAATPDARRVSNTRQDCADDAPMRHLQLAVADEVLRAGVQHEESDYDGIGSSTRSPLPFRPISEVALPLSTLSVREARGAPPFCFEAISPSMSLVLQAATQEEMDEWLQVLRYAIEASLGQRAVTPHLPSAITAVLKVEGNDACADCGVAHPTWASINLGIAICLECAGAHRRLGTHLSKVRSLELDTRQWSSVQVGIMCRLGNRVANQIWAPQSSDTSASRLGPDASPGEREAHVRAKYQERSFVSGNDPLIIGALHRAAAEDDVAALAALLARGANVEEEARETERVIDRQKGASGGPLEVASQSTSTMEANGDVVAMALEMSAAVPNTSYPVGSRPLHVAASTGSVHALEMLLLNSAEVEAEDSSGKTALRLAVEGGHAHVVEVLLTRGANISHADARGSTPIGAAQDLGHDDIMEAMLSYKLAQDEKLLAQVIHHGEYG